MLYIGTVPVIGLKKPILKCFKSGLFVNFGRFPCSLIPIRIRIPKVKNLPRYTI
jgi:hypothetical protein